MIPFWGKKLFAQKKNLGKLLQLLTVVISGREIEQISNYVIFNLLKKGEKMMKMNLNWKRMLK